MPLYGGIEAGGTKFVCAVGTGPENILEKTQFPTTQPGETIGRAIDFFRKQPDSLQAVGISAFGPLDLDPDSVTYGYITATPKRGWSNTNLVGAIQKELSVPVGFDTDVNGAVLAESIWGAGQGLKNLVYFTVGTGIGGGALVEGSLVHGLLHPEMGHMRIPHSLDKDPFPGVCPFHGDCFEGLAAGPAIEKRWGTRAENLPAGHPGWDLEAEYIALSLVNILLAMSPQRLILGGGVMKQRQLFPLIREKVPALLNGYVQRSEILDGIEGYIVPPGLGDLAGVLGGIALGQKALASQESERG